MPASAGRIVVGGEDVTRYGRRQWRALRRRGVVQYVFQDPLRSLDPDLTVGESLAEPLLLQGDLTQRGGSSAPGRYASRRAPRRTTCWTACPASCPAASASGSRWPERWSPSPQLVILDEPVSALDSANRVQVLEILKDLRAAGVALVFISHDLGSVAGVADRVAVLYQGRDRRGGTRKRRHHRPAAPLHPAARRLGAHAPDRLRGPHRTGRTARAPERLKRQNL